MFNCLIHLKPYEVGRNREADGGTVSPRTLLESQAEIWEDTLMLLRGMISLLFFIGKMSLTQLIFSCPLTIDQQHTVGTREEICGADDNKGFGGGGPPGPTDNQIPLANICVPSSTRGTKDTGLRKAVWHNG